MKIPALVVFSILLVACDPVQLPADYRLPDGAIYHGETRHKMFEGHGRLSWPDGTVYEGQFHHGVMQGKGRLKRANGCVYEGQFDTGQPNGKGRLECKDGVVYQGDFQHGELVKGKVDYPDDGSYQGELKDWQPQGKGTWTSDSGEVFQGTFYDGDITQGRYRDPSGRQYQGQFQNWNFNGQGVLTLANGDQHKARFENGLAQGAGERITGPAGDRHHEAVYFLDGDIVKGGPQSRQRRRHQQAARLEQRLYSEGRRLQSSLATLAPQRPGVRDIYLLAIGGDGRQQVFGKEVAWVEQQLGSKWDFKGRSLSLVNGGDGQQPLATVTSIDESLDALDKILDPKEDLLLIHITSHGDRDGDVVLAEPGLRLNDLSVKHMAAKLDAMHIRHQWLVVSACYSGQWVAPLRSPQRVIFTSAAKDRTSFGCGDDSQRTWFSKALYGKALQTLGLADPQALFQAADQRVEQLEQQQGIEGDAHSLPQQAIGDAFLHWWHSKAVAMPGKAKDQ
ncbi:MAG: C13 family peptidase [Alcanivorax sp.]|nr:C13 family peptidase [Alcanivorax sp.]